MLRAPVVLGTSNPGTVYTDFGGVARNVAQNLARLGCGVLLCSRVGDDAAGRQVQALPLDTSLISISGTRPTATYTAILESTGELVLGLADMDVYDEVTPEVLGAALVRLRGAELWFADTNLPGETLGWLLDAAAGLGAPIPVAPIPVAPIPVAPIPVAVDAISVAKSRRLLPLLPRIAYLFCNVAQAGAMAGRALPEPREAAEALLELGAVRGVVSAGARGIAVYKQGTITAMAALPAAPRDVTGAGDALVSGTLYGISLGLELGAAARLGLAAAAIAVESESSAAPCLTLEALHARA